MVLIPPPPMATTAEPTTMARIAYHRPVTIRGDLQLVQGREGAKDQHRDSALAMTWPPETLESRLDSKSVAALAMAAATTMITMATNTLADRRSGPGAGR